MEEKTLSELAEELKKHFQDIFDELAKILKNIFNFKKSRTKKIRPIQKRRKLYEIYKYEFIPNGKDFIIKQPKRGRGNQRGKKNI